MKQYDKPTVQRYNNVNHFHAFCDYLQQTEYAQKEKTSIGTQYVLKEPSYNGMKIAFDNQLIGLGSATRSIAKIQGTPRQVENFRKDTRNFIDSLVRHLESEVKIE